MIRVGLQEIILVQFNGFNNLFKINVQSTYVHGPSYLYFSSYILAFLMHPELLKQKSFCLDRKKTHRSDDISTQSRYLLRVYHATRLKLLNKKLKYTKCSHFCLVLKGPLIEDIKHCP